MARVVGVGWGEVSAENLSPRVDCYVSDLEYPGKICDRLENDDLPAPRTFFGAGSENRQFGSRRQRSHGPWPAVCGRGNDESGAGGESEVSPADQEV